MNAPSQSSPLPIRVTANVDASDRLYRGRYRIDVKGLARKQKPADDARRRVDSIDSVGGHPIGSAEAGSKDAMARLQQRRTVVTLLSLLCRSWIPFLLLGVVNRLMPKFDSVFFCYAGDRRYAEHYGWPQHRHWLRWFPSIIGAFEQGGRWGLICASPVTEEEFVDPANSANLDRLVARLELVRRVIGARRLALAGVLPTVVAQKRMETMSASHVDHTAKIVRDAIHAVRHGYFGEQPHAVVLLGGAGRVGRAVRSMLHEDGIDIRVVDTALVSTRPPGDSWKLSAAGQRILLVDVSRYGAIDQYVDQLPSGSVVLNEVFPEPRGSVLQAFRTRKIPVVHLVGARARVFPQLPFGYRGAVPCCAIHAPAAIDLVLRRLV